jgi:hypothetical protein
MELTLHNCQSISCDSYFPTNANCITLKVETEECNFNLEMYNLPKSVTEALLSIFPARILYGPPTSVEEGVS